MVIQLMDDSIPLRGGWVSEDLLSGFLNSVNPGVRDGGEKVRPEPSAEIMMEDEVPLHD